MDSSPFKFFYPTEIRYADLDPQGHVNNAKYLTYLEQSRIAYVINLGLWSGVSFFDIGFILADAHLSFKMPIRFGYKVQIGVRVSRLGNKSMTMEYRIEDVQSAQIFALGSTVQVAYDYHQNRSIEIPSTWREAIISFEGLK